MIKIESSTLESAYSEAAKRLECSVTELNIEVIQYPRSGFLGLFKKSAIIVATSKVVSNVAVNEEHDLDEEVEQEEHYSDVVSNELNDTILPNSFVTTQDEYEYDEEDYSHYQDDDGSDIHSIALEVQEKINALFSHLCYSLNAIKVEVYDENTLHVEFSGEDAALLIGKEGYRYKALSYIIFNWINAEYQLQLRMEIAEFLQNQEESVSRYLVSVCENIDRDGRAQTKVLDGVLVQIALKELRERYPQKYVAIRTTRDGLKYIIINDYNEY